MICVESNEKLLFCTKMFHVKHFCKKLFRLDYSDCLSKCDYVKINEIN